MKKIIDKVRYDTEKDTLIATNKPPEDELPLAHETEISLYKTKCNKYYIHMIYSISLCDEAILPMDREQAQYFCGLMTYRKVTENKAFNC